MLIYQQKQSLKQNLKHRWNVILTKDEIQIIAKKQKRPAGIIDKDYALEWLLYGIYHKNSKIKDYLIFKGGTAIRKIFFPSIWRFSEDLDFTVLPDANPNKIISGFKEIYGILEDEGGIKYESKLNVPDSGKAILGYIHFTGPLGMKNKIKIDASRIEKMVDSPVIQTVTVSYDDLSNFPINGYTLNEVVAEKIRSLMQRSKVRDYYDIWKMFSEHNNFDESLIGSMVKQKCTINDIKYNPSKIFDSSRLNGLQEHWEKELGRLVVASLPDPKKVFSEMENLLTFLPKSWKNRKDNKNTEWLYMAKDDCTLSKKTIRDIKEALDDIKKGRVLSHEQVKKRLGLD